MTTNRFMFFAGLFLVCMSTLMMQIIQTRILSVVSMYYLAFLSISMAMLGMTAGALLTYFKLGKVSAENVSRYLSPLSTAYALAILVCFLAQLASPLVVAKVGTLVLVWLKIIILLAAPFTVAGVIVSLALTRSPFPIGTTYGVDLAGAAFGCLSVLLLLNFVDAASAVFFVAAVAGLAGVCFRAASGGPELSGTFLQWRILRRPGLVTLALIVLAVANSATRYGLQPISAKFGTISIGATFDFEKWNTFSRILVSKSEYSGVFLWGRSPLLPADRKAEQRALNIDGFAGTTMPRFNGDVASVDFLKYDITNLAYAFRPPGRVAIIGVGSGRDLLSAYAFGAKDITGVELNPIFVDLLTDPAKLRNYAGIANLSGVRLFVDEGRSWFARTKEKFDVIEMSQIDTLAATGAGAFSLSENGLYTAEGWRIFLSALSPTGVFSVSRWHAPAAPIEMGRTTSLAVAALFSLGATKPRDHIFLATVGDLATIIVSRQPFVAAELSSLRDVTSRLQFKILASPDQESTELVIRDILSSSSAADLDAKGGNYWLDVSAPTDSRPFFFNQLRISNLLDLDRIVENYRQMRSYYWGVSLVAVGNFVAVGTLFLLIALSALAVLITVLLPARSSIYDVDKKLAWLGTAYFFLIGLGFMFIEIGLIQRISIFMGHPVYALSIVLFSIILSTGLGSLLSEKFSFVHRIGIAIWLGLLVAYVLALPYWLSYLTQPEMEANDLLVRSLVSIAAIFPAGILMGFGFPIGMRLVMSADSRPTPWFWGINGAAGVLAAGLAVACSTTFSIDVTIRVGGLSYLFLIPTALLLMRAPTAQRVSTASQSHGNM